MMNKFSEALKLYWPLYQQRYLNRQPLAQARSRAFENCIWRVQARLHYGSSKCKSLQGLVKMYNYLGTQQFRYLIPWVQRKIYLVSALNITSNIVIV